MTLLKYSIILLVVLILNNCTPPKQVRQEENIIQAPAKESFISGEVTQILNGKDGYTAKIKTADEQVFFVTISLINLKDPAQFRSVKIGEQLTVKGDSFKMNNEVHITVRELK